MSTTKVLLVDDDPTVLSTLCKILEHHEFEVTCVSTVPDALKHISSSKFDVLLSDLHMPGPGDGLTVVSAMRHANPDAVTILLSAFPEMGAATKAILMQTDEILVKPMEVTALIEAIRQRLRMGPSHRPTVESVATILERSTQNTIDDWYQRIKSDRVVMEIPLSEKTRTAHLPQIFRDLIVRLRSSRGLGSREPKSAGAMEHGISRRKQGYTAAMLVEESRMLQVSIFQTLQNNLATIDFSVLLLGVMTIADEIDCQLSQAMDSYTAESPDPAPLLVSA